MYVRINSSDRYVFDTLRVEDRKKLDDIASQVKHDENEDTRQMLSAAVKELRALADKYDIPVITAKQEEPIDASKSINRGVPFYTVGKKGITYPGETSPTIRFGDNKKRALGIPSTQTFNAEKNAEEYVNMLNAMAAKSIPSTQTFNADQTNQTEEKGTNIYVIVDDKMTRTEIVVILRNTISDLAINTNEDLPLFAEHNFKLNVIGAEELIEALEYNRSYCKLLNEMQLNSRCVVLCSSKRVFESDKDINDTIAMFRSSALGAIGVIFKVISI